MSRVKESNNSNESQAFIYIEHEENYANRNSQYIIDNIIETN